jgi:hypothetical protein
MSNTAPAMDLLRQGVPLALLFDLAGLGPDSEELYATERRVSLAPVVVELPRRVLSAVAS